MRTIPATVRSAEIDRSAMYALAKANRRALAYLLWLCAATLLALAGWAVAGAQWLERMP